MNRKYKDSVFIKLFSDEHNLRELYNALAGTNYGEDVELSINTLEDVLYMKRINDISFTIAGRFVVLIEYQSTINYNMPLRFLLYIARVYEKYLGQLDKNAIFRERRIPIPVPEFYLVHTIGDAPPELRELKLSDMFMARDGAVSAGAGAGESAPRGGPVNLELVVKVINIRKDRNAAILEQSRTLRMYAEFVAVVEEHLRRLRERMPQATKREREEAFKTAINYCIGHDILVKFLRKHASEVINMLMTKWDWKSWAAVREEEGYEEAKAEYQEQHRQDQEQHRQDQERIRQLEEENRTLRADSPQER
jgi:hypothetical protein